MALLKFKIFLAAILCYALDGTIAAPDRKRDVEPESPNPIQNTIDCSTGTTVTYTIFREHKNWFEAKTACEKIGQKLAQIFTDQELENIRQLTSKEDNPSYYWLGGSDAEKEGDWRWLSGVPIDPLYWALSEPNGGDSDDCLELNLEGELSDYNCNYEYQGYICELEVPPGDLSASASDHEGVKYSRY